MNAAIAFPWLRRAGKWLWAYCAYVRCFTNVTDHVHKVIQVRHVQEQGVKSNEVHCEDMLQIILDAQKKSRSISSDSDGTHPTITDQHIPSNCFVALGGGFETTALTLMLLLDELARNPQEQE
ncbi:hypothetical protein HPB48_026087 [Haemaphysalis longicornis]|uniref:Cytochrome P450 n=1 Tax=Haemaphysalis longicornis TaxID=44386 RepID=A0A9J6HBI3_HAELO|nr:hypothetical protein HPB48_026087 [Haemaphysalis longicornis]